MELREIRILTPDEAGRVLDLIRDLKNPNNEEESAWRAGKAVTPEATERLKHNTELLPGYHPAAKRELEYLNTLIQKNKEIHQYCYPKKSWPPKFNRYTGGGDYDWHTDASFMGQQVRTDYSCTLALTPASEYEGGVLTIRNEYGETVECKPDAGVAVIYNCGRPHCVTPVTEGERISAVCWIESEYRDIEQRRIMRMMHKGIAGLRGIDGVAHCEPETLICSAASELSRMWSGRS